MLIQLIWDCLYLLNSLKITICNLYSKACSITLKAIKVIRNETFHMRFYFKGLIMFTSSKCMLVAI
jgi:hypothetical protein